MYKLAPKSRLIKTKINHSTVITEVCNSNSVSFSFAGSQKDSSRYNNEI